MKKLAALLPMLLLVLALTILFVVPVFAKGLGQDVTPPDPATTARVIDMAFLIAITGFIKAQFNVKGKVLIGAAFAVWLVLWFTPELTTALGPIFVLVLGCVKGFLGALGTFDTAIDAGQKITGNEPDDK